MWRPLDLSLRDGGDLLKHMETMRVSVKLAEEESTRDKITEAVQRVLDQYADKDFCKNLVLLKLAKYTLYELFKSKVVDLVILRKFIEIFPGVDPIRQDDEDEDYDLDKYFKSTEEDSDSSDDDDMDEIDEDDGDGDDDEDEDDDVDIDKMTEAVIKKYEDAGIETMLEEAKILQLHLKQGEEKQMIYHIAVFLIEECFGVSDSLDVQSSVRFFMRKLQAYIAKICVLEDLETVEKAIKNADLSVYEHLKLQQQDYKEEVKLEDVQIEDCGSATRGKEERKIDKLLVC